MSRPTVYYKDDNEHNIHTEQAAARTKDTSREAADRGQRALAERLSTMPYPKYGPEGQTYFMAKAAAILGEHGVYLPDGANMAVRDNWDRLQRIETLLRYLWSADVQSEGGRKDGGPVSSLFTEDDPLFIDIRAALATDGAET